MLPSLEGIFSIVTLKLPILVVLKILGGPLVGKPILQILFTM
ncbi:hypothetical protein COXBURSA334_1708 [Coxiella burnetii Q321]|nr:hypothetical protein COXBURSA334_1708 [Coxiella burnetii Q321]